MGIPAVEAHAIDIYHKNKYEHISIKGYCISSEEQNINLAKDDNNFRLKNISHGAHLSDFLLSLTKDIDTSGWREDPIAFVYETPSLDYGFYKKVPYENCTKSPSKEYYWIHKKNNMASYPEYFCGGEYGGFLLSCIITFKLKNVYITNLVKCGLNDDNGRFKGLASYREECIKNCYDNFLKQENSLFNPKLVFAVGSSVENWLNYFFKDIFLVQQLPHPAGRSRDEHYRVLYFWLVAEALYKAGIVSTEESGQLAKFF